MTTGPEDDKAAGGPGRGHLRASRADREQVIATLKVAFIEGRLTKDEFDLRVGQTLGSRTFAELTALTADLPAGVPAARPARTPDRAWAPKPGKAARTGACAGLALALLGVAAFLGPGDGPERLIGLALFFLPLCGVSAGGLLLLHAWLEKRSRGQLPQGPAPGSGLACQRRESMTRAGPVPQIDQGSSHTAEAAPRHLPRPAVARLVAAAPVAP
jgi:hypothetical protein